MIVSEYLLIFFLLCLNCMGILYFATFNLQVKQNFLLCYLESITNHEFKLMSIVSLLGEVFGFGSFLGFFGDYL